jgi:tetratricopeptide (TPR) repeat protein
MSKTEILWIIKSNAGQVKGPYATAALMRLIGEGVFSGTEMVSRYPGGQWTSLSQEPQFYDKLLEALESSVEAVPKRNALSDEETIVPPVPEHLKDPTPKPRSILERMDTHRSAPQHATLKVVTPKTMSANSKSGKNATSVIELKSISQAQKQALLKNMKIPTILVVAAALLAIYVLFSDAGDSSEKLSLIGPIKGAAAMSDSQVKEKLALAIAAIEADTTESYLEAQNNLVAIVEGSPSNLEVRGLLCVVYKQLWPFAKQDAGDIRVISGVTQSTRSLDSVGPYGSTCEIVNLETSGRYKEARGVVESALETAGRSTLLPILFFFKGELLEADKNYSDAFQYYQKSSQLWDTWLRPRVNMGVTSRGMNKGPEAAQFLKSVLDKNPGHREAKIQLGLLQEFAFKKEDDAFKLLKSAMDSHSRIPHALEAEGAFGLAQIYLNKNEKGPALSMAQRAYSLGPNNPDYKQLVVRLGGSDKIQDKKGNSEMMFVGDQYARSGDCLAAQAEFKAAFEVDPKNGMAAVKAAKCLWQLNQTYEAIEWLNKAVKAEPKLITAYVLLADYMSRRYDFSGATIALTNATRISPNNYEILRGMALIEFRRNNMQGAVNFGLRALRVYDADIETYTLLAKASASLYSSTVSIGKKEIETREALQRDALRYATKAVELDATSSEAQITYAKVLAQINGVDSGVSYMKELIKKYSYSHDYRMALAEIYRGEERFRQALDYYSQVSEADPKNKKAFIGLGECYKAMGMVDQSLKAFLSAAVLDPSDGEALFQAGKLYLESNRFDEAIKQFKRVQNINPNFPRANYFIGKAAFMSGNFAMAFEAVKREKQDNPNLADSYLLAAEVYSAKKQFSECAAEYSVAMKLRPPGAEIYVKAAQCYRQSGSVDVAQDMLTMASARESGFADIYKEQGSIYEIKGDIRAAVQSYNKYLGLSPNATDRGEIEARINRIGN